ncbi:MAG: hypothetical protein HY708_00055 [Ignavibacteriae bacterium]|nr:hypothetical protein [Ignavibacteriota bacterium]
MKGCMLMLVFGLVSVETTFGQTPPPVFAPSEGFPEIVTFFAPVFFPKVIQDGYQLKMYIRSEEFNDFRASFGDVYAVDAIFDRAVRLSWNNLYEALLISFVATMDHNKFGVRLPVVGALFWVPLTSEFDDEFRARVDALPGRLYPDSPSGRAGDRDKLQHFFGSALLTYTFESLEAAERVGRFIEWGEDLFIVDGVLDDRDFRANVQGQDFGLRLLDDNSVRPSMFLKYHLAQDPTAHIGCVPTGEIDSLFVNQEAR